jgi:hypothetical protein
VKTRAHKTRPEHEIAYQDLCALVNRHADKLTALELLAIGANMLGKLLALQDQRTTTQEMAMRIIIENIQEGNQQVVAQLMKSEGSA